MRHSKFSEEKRIEILKEKDELRLTTEELCSKHKISMGTYYIWKRNYDAQHVPTEMDLPPSNDLKKENNTLRRLYINLSEHNYELAKFLNK